MRVGFLFNHHVPHQVLHAAPVAFALSTLEPAVEVQILATCDRQLAVAAQVGSHWPDHRVRLQRVALPTLDNLIQRARMPLWRVSKRRVLHANRALLSELDALVVPERTSVELRRYPELDHVRLIHIPHGAGDRAIGYETRSSAFDLVLAPGEKCRRRFIDRAGLPPERVRVIGYPKFDVGHAASQLPAFPEQRPIVLYNPHFDRRLSSWWRFGRQVLDWFASQTTYNLIFAPHVMLYRRPLRHRARPLGRYRGLPHVLLDVASDRCLDMTYTRAADIYLGDVSSQIYEFVRRARPAVFLNAAGVMGWRHDDCYRHWNMGTVIDRLEDLPTALQQPLSAAHTQTQQMLVRETFHEAPESASLLGARAILRHMNTPPDAVRLLAPPPDASTLAVPG